MFAPDPLEALAHLAAAEGDPSRAAQLLGAADTLRAELGIRRQGIDEAERFQLTIVEARAALGDGPYEAAFAEGATLRYEDAIAYALESRN